MKRFFPVIHVNNSNQVKENILRAQRSKCDGVFLINHNQVSEQSFVYLIDESVIKYQSDNFKIGVNFLSFDNITALIMAQSLKCKMLWVDNAGTDKDNLIECQKVKGLQESIRDKVEYFGGVQFKYQPKPDWNLTVSIERSLPWVDVATLSGVATGVPAEIEKIKNACRLFDSNRFALASGISEDNVELFLPYVDNFLVASSIIEIEDGVEMFNSDRLQRLENKIHAWV